MAKALGHCTGTLCFLFGAAHEWESTGLLCFKDVCFSWESGVLRGAPGKENAAATTSCKCVFPVGEVYMSSSTFHQREPAPSQMITLARDTRKPSFHQVGMSIYPAPK